MFSFITEGGIFMYILLGISIVALAVIIERFYALHFYFTFNASFFSKLVKQVKTGNLSSAEMACTRTNHPLARAAHSVINHAGHSREPLESAASISYQKIVPEIQKRTSYVSMIGNIATLVGLLGTIQGLIIAFKSLAGADAAVKAELLARGISTAMNTTAFGLIIGIPCVIAFTVLTSKEERILSKYEETLSEIVHHLSLQRDRSKQGRSSQQRHSRLAQ